MNKLKKYCQTGGIGKDATYVKNSDYYKIDNSVSSHNKKYKIIDDIPDSWLTEANLKRRIPISIFSKNISKSHESFWVGFFR